MTDETNNSAAETARTARKANEKRECLSILGKNLLSNQITPVGRVIGTARNSIGTKMRFQLTPAS